MLLGIKFDAFNIFMIFNRWWPSKQRFNYPTWNGYADHWKTLYQNKWQWTRCLYEKGKSQVSIHNTIILEVGYITEIHYSQVQKHNKHLFDQFIFRYLDERNFTVPWDTMNRMHFNFNVTTVTYRRLGKYSHHSKNIYNFR